MKSSDSIHLLAEALVAAQADLKGVGKDATNPHFKSKYATYDAIIGMVRPALAPHGLAVVQSAEPTEDGKALLVETRLIHISGQWLSNTAFIPLGKLDPQGAGAAITYGRRFGLSALLAISTDDDDDGNAASAKPAPARSQLPAVPQGTAALRTAAPSDDLKAPYTGHPADRKVKGTRLGDMPKADLEALKKWAQDKGEAYLPLAKDINKVLIDLALGTSDDKKVERMKAAEDKQSAELPL